MIPTPELNLSHNSIHIWKAILDQPEPIIQKIEHILSADELVRAKKFYFQRDSERFIISRGILRLILGVYTNRNPVDLIFQYGTHGKPYLEQEICFNMSHSGGLAVYAFTRNVQVGIDVEHIRQMPDAEEIIARFFSSYENSVFRGLPEDQKQEAFFRCWTLKEAYIKAIGDGLAHPLDQFSVSYAPGEPARLLDSAEARWLLKDFIPASGYIAAIALEKNGKDFNWQFLEWTMNSDQLYILPLT